MYKACLAIAEEYVYVLQKQPETVREQLGPAGAWCRRLIAVMGVRRVAVVSL